MRILANLLAIFTVAAAGLGGAVAQQPSRPASFAVPDQEPVRFPEQIKTSFYLPLRDGVRLAVDLYQPAVGGKAAPGRFPVVWHHTFDRRTRGEAPTNAVVGTEPGLTKYGYVVAVVERRGLGASFGERRGYNDRVEAQDAYEVNEWLAAQPWSNGNVGIVGCSNTGAAAMHAITMRPPHLKAAFVGCFAWDTYDWTLRGGLFAQWGTGVTRTLEQDMQALPVDGDETKTLLRQAAEEHQKSTDLATLWRGIPYRDGYSPLTASRFWSEGSIAAYADQMRQSGVALYIIGGWHDDLRKDGLVAFRNWSSGKVKITIGPWMHCQSDGVDMFSEMKRFFDFHLKGVDNGIMAEAPIRYFTVNAPAGQEWKSASTWPLPEAKPTAYHLAPRGRLLPAQGGGATAFKVSQNVDCPPPVSAAQRSGPFAQPCVNAAAASLFVTPQLTQDTEVTGHPVADIWVSADATDANIFVYLEDIAPDGTATTLTDGRQRASLRKVVQPPYDNLGLPWRRSYKEDVQLLVPGAPVRMQFDLFPVSYVFKKGHRIRVSVTGADYRERDRAQQNPAVTITIRDTKKMPSTVALPIAKRG
ncbi:MAG TPA: CocE/NonD family hydrolase [Hyphomonadaceae bacterium]|jgi:putative CocE/NonD family hydrolase|nr:CocE/NonD family hydrolase [Hyphomonadaceae bacterium]